MLSSNIQAKVHLTDVEKILYDDVVTREEFETAAGSYWEQVTKPVAEVLEKAGIEKSKVF